jgi:hypothetical protein
MVEFKPGNPLQNIKKNLSPIAEETWYSGVGSPSRTAEDLQLTEEDIKGFVKRRKAAIKKQKKAGALGLTKTILEESYNPRFSLDYNEKLPILPGLYTQSNTAIKDKLIAEQLDIAQQKEDYNAALSNKAPPNLGIMSPRELLKSLNTSDFTPISPTGLTDGPIASPPDKPTDINNLPFFSLTGPSETGPSAGGLLRFAGAAQFSNPLSKPAGSLGSGFGFNLKGMKGINPDDYLTKSIVAKIQQSSDETGKALLKDALEIKGVNIKDRFKVQPVDKKFDVIQKDDSDIGEFINDGADVKIKLAEFDTNLPDNSKVIKEALAKGNPKNLPILRVKDLMIQEDLSGLSIDETKKSPFYATNVASYFNDYPERTGFTSSGYKRGLPAFRVAFSEEGVGLKAKGVTSPYSLSKTYKHPQVVGEEGLAPLYGHVRSLELKELEPGTVHPYTAQDFTNQLFNTSNRSNQLLKPSLSYRQIKDLEELNMLDPSKRANLETITIGGEDASVYDKSTAGFNNYGIKSGTEEDDFIGDFIVQFPTEVEDASRAFNRIEGLLTFKQRMQKLNAILQLVPVPNISLQTRIKDGGNYGLLLRGGIENNRMTIDEVLEFIKGGPVFKEYAGDTPELLALTEGTESLKAIENSINSYAQVAISNSFNPQEGNAIREKMFLPSVAKPTKKKFTQPLAESSELPYIYINTGVGEFNQGMFRGKAGEPITVDAVVDYLYTLAKIDAQSLILSDDALVKKFKLDNVPGFVNRPKIRLNKETGSFEVVPSDVPSEVGKTGVIDIDAEAIGILKDTGTINLIEELKQWDKLGGQDLYKLYRASAASSPSSMLARNFPTELRDTLKSIELNWGKGKRVKRLGEEQFDTFKTSQFKSPEVMLDNMNMSLRGDAILTPEQQMERFERAYNLEEEIDTTRELAYGDMFQGITNKAFANLQKRPDKLVEISTMHNIKQALQDGFDKLQFNTFPTMADLAGWSNNLVDSPALWKEYFTSSFKDKISSNDNFLYKVVTEDLDELASKYTKPGSSLGSLPVLDNVNDIPKNLEAILTGKEPSKYFDDALIDDFREFWLSYNEKFNLDALMENFIKKDFAEDGKSMSYFVDTFGRKHEYTGNNPTSFTKYSNLKEILELFSPEKSKQIYKVFTQKVSTSDKKILGFKFRRYKEEDVPEKIQAFMDAVNRVNIINHFQPKMGRTPFAFYKERKTNPFYIRYGMPDDKKLGEVIAKMPVTDNDGNVKQKNLGFSLQYGKYKIKALEELGLQPKVVRPDEDSPFTFIEINLGDTAAEKAELLKKVKAKEINLYSQYMPIPSFEERSEEEMGAT